MRNQQRGYSMTELAIVISIVIALGAMMWPTISRIFSGMRANKIGNELALVIPTIQTSYQNRTSYAGLTTAQVAQSRWISDGFIEMNAGVPTGKIITQFGNMEFAPAASNTQVEGTIDKIPTLVCTKLIDALDIPLYQSVSVNGTVVKATAADMDKTTAGTQCSSAAENTIVFTFGRA